MLSDDIRKSWYDILLKIAQEWVFNCDSGCFSEVCDRQAWTNGSILVIYQPHKSMREYDDMYATIFMKRTDKAPITAKDLQDAHLEDLNKLVLQSYNDILEKSKNKWTHAIDGTFDQLIQIKKPLQIEKGALKMTFEIRGAVKWCCGDSWTPHRLLKFENIDEEVIDEPDFYDRLTEDAIPAKIDRV